MARVQVEVRTRILRAFVGRGLIERFEAREMLAYRHSGFSVNVGARIEAQTALAWSGCCAAAHAHRLRLIGCASGVRIWSTNFPNPRAVANRPTWCSRRWN